MKNLPQVGSTYVFPLGDGLLGACRVLRNQFQGSELRFYSASDRAVFVAVTRWTGSSVPDISNADLKTLMRFKYGEFARNMLIFKPEWSGKPFVMWTTKQPPQDYQLIGIIEPSAEELKIEWQGIGGWSFAGAINLQLLWERDPEACERELEERTRQMQEDAAARRKERVDRSIEQMSKEKLFPHISYMPKRQMKVARAIIKETIARVRGLSERGGSTGDKLAALQSAVQQFNEMQNQSETKEDWTWIDTTFRESIFLHLEQIASAGGVLSDFEKQFDSWPRDW